MRANLGSVKADPVRREHRPVESDRGDSRRDVIGILDDDVDRLASEVDPGLEAHDLPFEDDDLPLEVGHPLGCALRVPGTTMAEVERWAILTTLAAMGGSTAKTAELLDLSIRTIQYRLHEYQASPEPKAKRS